MCDFKPNKSSNEAARLDKKAVHTIEDIFLDQEDVHTNLECGGNTPNIYIFRSIPVHHSGAAVSNLRG